MLYKSTNTYVSKKRFAKNDKPDSSENPSKKSKKNDDDEEDEDDDDTGDNEVYRIGTAVYYDANVTKKSIGQLRKVLNEATEKALNSMNTLQKPIVTLYIHSNGGDVFAGFAGYSLIRRNIVPIVTIADGYVASAATFLLLGGKTRYIIPGSQVLIHQLSTLSFGKFQEISDDYKNCKNIMSYMEQLYKTETKLTAKKLEKLLKSELDLTDKQCIKFEIVNGHLPTL